VESPSFDFSLQGRKYGGRGWKYRAVVYLNIVWDYGTWEFLRCELHETLHALLHKIGFKFVDHVMNMLTPDVLSGFYWFLRNVELIDN